jgi:hypothetical protein
MNENPLEILEEQIGEVPEIQSNGEQGTEGDEDEDASKRIEKMSKYWERVIKCVATMKLPILFLFLSSVCQAIPYTVRIDASVKNIGTSFASYGQLYGVSIRNPQSIFIDNRTTSSEIAVNCATAGVQPNDNGLGTDGIDHNFYVAGSEAWAFSTPSITSNCWVRSMTGSTLSSGVFVIIVTGG